MVKGSTVCKVAGLSGENDTAKKRGGCLGNLWLLGGEIIRQVNFEPPLRGKPASVLLADVVDEEGGPCCRHLDSEAEMRSFDATCKKLHKYIHTRRDR